MCGCLWHALSWGPGQQPGMCPDWESNRRPSCSQASAQSTEPHQPGLRYSISFENCIDICTVPGHVVFVNGPCSWIQRTIQVHYIKFVTYVHIFYSHTNSYVERCYLILIIDLRGFFSYFFASHVLNLVSECVHVYQLYTHVILSRCIKFGISIIFSLKPFSKYNEPLSLVIAFKCLLSNINIIILSFF